ncbi:hypothetical protein M2447_000488 [Ereboglobus sp. PH5-10]|uniref:hypothetical protein n=1 Tax=Ereboglobus sp. PH5-10 TaxID=2940629 RepID=UPI00240660E6|nr:hypothetical protein [Ereboglobus sp. PH5-10]MDF9826407.1 hypothetical protein [Ereboglobus sp. PH5-10]
MNLTFKEIPGWTFDVDEVSANVFKVVGRDGFGRSFEKTGLNPDGLLEEAKQYVLKTIAELDEKRD